MIRYILLFWVICTCLSPGYAQTDFAPPGAHWYNSTIDGYFHSFSDGDTIIQGITATRIRRIAVVPPGSWTHSEPEIYVYSSPDTVFVYNALFKRFTPFYIFNVHPGDTVRIPEFYIDYAEDTVFSYVVDSIKTIQYDTSWLKTVYVTTIEPTGWGPYAHASHGPCYIERIGNIATGIYPLCYGCPVVLGDGGSIDALRCYSDPTTSIKLISGECDPPVSVRDNGKEITSNAWPNPASEVLHIDAAIQSTIILLSSDGREVLRKVTETTYESVDVSQLRSGVYLLLTIDATGTRSRKINVHR